MNTNTGGNVRCGFSAAFMFCLMALPLSGEEPPQISRARIVEKPSGETAEAVPKSHNPTGGELVHLAAKLYQVVPGQPDKLIAAPLVTVPSGQWATVEDVTEITYAVSYDPASLPESIAKEALGGGTTTTDGKPKAAKKWNTLSVNAVLPPFPSEFETRDLGWKLKLRPQVAGDGSITVSATLDQSALRGFVNHGLPITRETTGPLGGRPKTQTLSENRQLLPVFLSHRQELVLVPTKSGFEATVKSESAAPLAKELALVEGFAAEYCRAELPELRLELTAAKATPPPADPPTHQPDSQIFVTIKAIELGFELGHEDMVTINTETLENPILTDSKFQMLIRELNQRKGVDLLSAPSILMRNGQEGKVEIIREFIYPTSYEPPRIPKEARPETKGENVAAFPVTPANPKTFATRDVGVQFGVTARILADGQIEMDLEPAVSEHLGFLNFGQPIVLIEERDHLKDRIIEISENRMVGPLFYRRNLKTTARLPDGHTILVGGLIREDVQVVEDKVPILSDLPLIGRALRSQKELSIRRHLYFLISAKLVDPAGMPVKPAK